jgi:lipopolysaccharide/colanic/teichoic acid biosynthesis glycosyltransferase
MRKYAYLIYDLLCIVMALLVALYLRHGFPLIQEGNPHDIYVLVAVTLGTAVCVLSLMHTHDGMWRFTSASELASMMLAVAVVVLVGTALLFTISRLDMMPRSVPPMHWALAVVAMGGSRLMARHLFGPERHSSKHHLALKQHVVVIGACHTAELYFEFIKRIVQHQVLVEGVLDSDKALTYRLFQKRKILGTPADLPRLLEEFHVHGIHITHVILAQLLEDLPIAERSIVLDLEQRGAIQVVQFAKDMVPQFQPRVVRNPEDFYQNMTEIAPHSYEKPAGVYPYVKRGFDVVFGLVALVLCAPLLLLTSLLVVVDVGLPLIFWQKRPGLYGRGFSLYKFRTMRRGVRRLNENRLAHKSGDVLRTSAMGKMLRRFRLDELPQLFHIVAGTMSFVGPRPLLPDDQPEGGQARLSVRPGVTGWAQIHGGDVLSPEEKLVLDVWYIRHMSLALDLTIMFRTLLVVVKEDMRRDEAIPSFAQTKPQGPATHEQS